MNFKFGPEELKNEPKDNFLWFHYSCVLWNNKILINDNIDLSNLKIKNFEEICDICKTNRGCVINCTKN